MASSLEGNLCIITGATSTGIDEMCLSFMRRCHLFGALTCAGVATTAFSTKLCLTQCGRYVTAEPAEASTVCRPSASVCRCLLSVACCPLSVVRCMLSVVCCLLSVAGVGLPDQQSHADPRRLARGAQQAPRAVVRQGQVPRHVCAGKSVASTCNVQHQHQITE